MRGEKKLDEIMTGNGGDFKSAGGSSFIAVSSKLNDILTQALEAGLTDEHAVRNMKRNVEIGKFASAHYENMWLERFDQAGLLELDQE